MTHPSDAKASTGNGSALGWISGLGWPFLAWLLAGIVSTFTPEPESTFPAVLAGSAVAVVAWLAFGSIRIVGFKRGAVWGALISLGVGLVLWAVLLASQP